METSPKKSPSVLRVVLYIFLAILAASAINGFYVGFNESSLDQNAVLGLQDSLTIARADSIKKVGEAEKAKAKEEAAKNAQKLLKGLKVKRDEFEDVSFYYGRSIPYINTNRLFVYMPYQEGYLPALRMKVQYAGEDWIFWNEAELKVDGEKMSLLGMGTVERDNGNGKVWEFTDSPVDRKLMDDENNLRVIRKVAASKSTTLRLSGKYRKDRTITTNEKKSMQDVLAAYDALIANQD